MKELLNDIINKLSSSSYKNEEHVRLSLLTRVLQYLGWDIWNPQEVNSEFYAIPSEDRSRVDLALFLTATVPIVFFEVKAPGKIDPELVGIERQLRDYNRNLTAMFSIITDGRKWRFYYSQAGGEFSQKCFKTIDFFEDDLDDIETFFMAFLGKTHIENGEAERDARSYLQLSQKQRAMDDALPQARRMIDQPPFPSLPEALIERVAAAGFNITREEATEFIKNSKPVEPPHIQPSAMPPGRKSNPILKRASEPDKWTPSDYSAGPEALRQILEVIEHMYRNRSEFGDAAVDVARRRNITPGTVRHHCTRALGLDTYQFKILVKDASNTVSFLQKKFPQFSDVITERIHT